MSAKPPVTACDLLVVGGGPAGAAAALQARAVGLQVVLVEREGFPRDRPGETLHPGIEPLLRQLNVWQQVLDAGFERHRGHWINHGGGAVFEAFGTDRAGDWLGLQAWRAVFDGILLIAARRRGTLVLQPARAIAPLVQDGRVSGVLTSEGPVQAKITVDAAGGCHWLARRLKLAVVAQSTPLIAWYGYARGSCPARDDAPCFEVTEDGWLWTAKVGKDLYAWTRLSHRDRRKPVSWGPVSWRPEIFRPLEARGRERGAEVTWRMVSATAGPGYFIAGDAGAVVDPAASHGVLRAVMSGMMAAHLASKQIRENIEEDLTTACYDDWLRKWQSADIERLGSFYFGGTAPSLTLGPLRAQRL